MIAVNKKIFLTLAGFLFLAILSGNNFHDLTKIGNMGNLKTSPGLAGGLRMWDHGKLQVSPNRRYLEHADGTSFLWIGDTAWEIFYRLRSSNPEGHDIEEYFQDRKNKGFTLIQAVLIEELDYKKGRGCAENGSTPFVNMDPGKRVEAYWNWVDHVVERAQEYGLYMCMLPAWGNWVNDQAIFNRENAYDYGVFLGARYKDSPNIIWMLGGDRHVNENQKAIWNSLAAGIKSEIGDNFLMTFHPAGAKSSSMDFHDEPWLDFNNFQSGHQMDGNNSWNLAIADWERTPTKPTLNSEPGYEGIVEKFWESCDNPRFIDYDVRKDAYRSLLAGSFGHTYGHSSIWQMLRPGDTPVACADPDVNWYDAIHSIGSSHMTHIGNLLKSRPADRWREESLVVEGMGYGKDRMGASRGDDFAFIYFPAPIIRTIQMNKISGSRVNCYWYNTRTGESNLIGTYKNSGTRTFSSPEGLDWLLVIDDADAGYSPPGMSDIWYH
ncbi:Putative collagen-binding domain of a collagenase [Aquiflexum balticum DSM 16537]|uniref:Putative collagen-binding domain of a collagenase n=1 Tax=Aquiflexum balticum DSM 16537 TaxID=758820 RepID=A0A1W2H9N1_9BACT|nr:Putative collagen-binding domain of a collagenase [Aquiflexum balticum DSM 16537]